MNITGWSLMAQLGLVILVITGRFGFERWLAGLFKKAKVESISVQIFAKSIIMLVFNVIILLLFGLLVSDLFSFANGKTGFVYVAIGLGAALLVAGLTYMAIKAGYGGGYGELSTKSTLEGVLTWSTFLLLVGPAEDLFFIGFVQNLLQERTGWIAIVIYAVLFTLYHYANVLSGVETKKEFLGTLPIRLLVVTLLALSFHATGSLLFGFIIHNAVDTISYAAMLLGMKKMGQAAASG